MTGQYTVELFYDREVSADFPHILARDDSLEIAGTLYKFALRQYPDRLIMLCDRARVLARSDWPQ